MVLSQKSRPRGSLGTKPNNMVHAKPSPLTLRVPLWVHDGTVSEKSPKMEPGYKNQTTLLIHSLNHCDIIKTVITSNVKETDSKFFFRSELFILGCQWLELSYPRLTLGPIYFMFVGKKANFLYKIHTRKSFPSYMYTDS